MPRYTITDPSQAENICREAFAQSGPELIKTVMDMNKPPMPGQITTEQARKFAEALLRGESDRFDIIKTVIADKIHEVI